MMAGMRRDHAQDADIQQTEQLDPHRQLQENEEAPASGDPSRTDADARSHFFSVANALLAALDPNTPELNLPERLNRREIEAIKLIFEARTGKESEEGHGEIFAAERMRYLNVGLTKLQRSLAIARSPDFPQARRHIEEIRKRIARLRDELRAQQIADERRRRRQKEQKRDDERKKKEEDQAAKEEGAAE